MTASMEYPRFWKPRRSQILWGTIFGTFDFSGASVFGNVEEIPRLVEEHDVDHVIITIADPSPGVTRRIVEVCEAVPVRAHTIPSFLDIVQGKRAITAFQDVDYERLLGRDPISLETNAAVTNLIRDRIVMVTGAGDPLAPNSPARRPSWDRRSCYWWRDLKGHYSKSVVTWDDSTVTSISFRWLLTFRIGLESGRSSKGIGRKCWCMLRHTSMWR